MSYFLRGFPIQIHQNSSIPFAISFHIRDADVSGLRSQPFSNLKVAEGTVIYCFLFYKFLLPTVHRRSYTSNRTTRFPLSSNVKVKTIRCHADWKCEEDYISGSIQSHFARSTTLRIEQSPSIESYIPTVPEQGKFNVSVGTLDVVTWSQTFDAVKSDLPCTS